MRVLLLSNFYFPEKTGIGVTATDCARFIKELGHKVTVVTTMPYYPEWEVPEEYRSSFYRAETIFDIPVKRVWLYVPKTPSTLKRILHELSGSTLSFLRSLFIRTDLVLCMSPPLTLGFASLVLAKLRGKKYWCCIKDIQPDAAIDLGMLNNPLMKSVSFWMERHMYRGAEKILVLSEGMGGNIIAKGVPKEKIVVVPDSIDCRELAATDRSRYETEFRQGHNLGNSFVVLYSGNLGIKHNVEIIAECAALLRDNPDVRFFICGEGAAKPAVATIIEREKLTNITLLPLCPREELGDMLCSADVLLAPQRKEVRDIVVPSKLLAYLSTGRPIVASATSDSESAKLLRENQAGLVVEPENAAELVKALLRLKDNEAEAKSLGQCGAELVKTRYDHSIVKERYYEPLFKNL